jgi:uncharacterized protein YraI
MARRKKEEVTEEVVEKVEKIEEAASKKPAYSGTYKTIANLNFRKRAGDMTDTAIIAVIKMGEKVVATGNSKVIGDETWVEISYAMKAGWVMAKFITK